MPRSRPTIIDVARRAGVSKGAVSFALNDRPGVSAETRERIHAAAEELGWRPNLRARALPANRAFAIGLVVARPPRLLSADPFFPAFIAGVESILSAHDLALVLQVVPDAASEAAGYRRLVSNGRVDGVLLTDVRVNDPRIGLLHELQLPAVTLGRPVGDVRFPAVVADDAAGIRAALDHLIALGHTRIAHVAGPDQFIHGRSRFEAWRHGLVKHGLPPSPYRRADFSPADGARATTALLRLAKPPTAIIYASDVMAIAGMNAARGAGLRLPADLSVTGFDDAVLAAYTTPSLTTVHVDAVSWGRLATTTLLRLINEGHVDDVATPAPTLVVRESTGRAPRSRKGSSLKQSRSDTRTESVPTSSTIKGARS